MKCEYECKEYARIVNLPGIVVCRECKKLRKEEDEE